MAENNKAQIGKDVIESLTLGMYEDCRFIYREYVQNAADQVDKAVAEGLMNKGEEHIQIEIDPENRSIIIEDNATGIAETNVVPILRNIAHSTKQRGVDKGFRGIGRLGGLGYCAKLRFETSYKGEPVKSIMTWDAELLKFIINDRDNQEEAVEVLERVTDTKTYQEAADAHYFRVVMEDVSSDDLLDIKSVTDYLSMVAPVEINSRFIFRSKIREYMKENNLSLDTYNIYINDTQIYKPYTNYIYEDNHGGKKQVDDILDVDFLMEKDENDEIIYWGWYSLSRLNGQMKPLNIARGIRLRKSNIQIGDEEICKKFFTKTEDQRYSFYYFGEIHAVSKNLIPNSRRDYFGENPACTEFERLIKQDFLDLREMCYDASKFRSSKKTIAKESELKGKIEEKDKTGYTSKQEKEYLNKQFEEYQKKAGQARKQLESVTNKLQNSNSPLRGILDRLAPEKKEETEQQKANRSQQPANNQQEKTKFRTDNPIYSQYSKQEKKLIGRIYTAISNAITEELFRDALINKIEEELTR